MSQRNAGEMTESYSTYIKRHIYTFIAGLILGWITLAIGVYTDWYLRLLNAVWNFHTTNPILFAIEGVGAGVIATILYINRPKKLFQNRF